MICSSCRHALDFPEIQLQRLGEMVTPAYCASVADDTVAFDDFDGFRSKMLSKRTYLR